MKRNRDDRRDNVDRIQKNINHTIGNIEAAEELARKPMILRYGKI